jgi:aryl sulfotransferase
LKGPVLEKRYCTWLLDSDRWRAYRPRANDVILTTYPKSGTTWVQRVLSLLLLRAEEPVALDRTFPWWEGNRRPIETVAEAFDAQPHRRSLKTHVPFDGLPWFDQAKYLHLARDARDLSLSYHNHSSGFRSEELARMDAVGLAEPALRRTYPRVDPDPARQFHNWLTVSALPGQADGTPYLSYFAYEKSFWESPRRRNFFFIHYADLKTDLTGEMRRLADFIEVDVTDAEIAGLAEAASFASMRRDAASLLPDVSKNFEGGALRLVNKGQSGNWRDLYDKADVELFDRKLRSAVPDAYADWLIGGRLATGIDPARL